MRINKKILLVSGILVLAGLIAFADWQKKVPAPIDAKDEFRKLYSSFKSQNSVHVTGMIHILDRQQRDELVEETSFEYIGSESAYYARLDYLENFYDGKLAVQLDTVNRYLALSETPKEQKSKANNTVFPFEQFMNDTASFQVHLSAGDKNDDRWLKITSDLNPEIKSCIVFYDPVSFRLKKVELEYWKDGVVPENPEDKKCWLVKIEYQYQLMKPLNIRERMDQLFTIKKKRIELAERFRDYSIY